MFLIEQLNGSIDPASGKLNLNACFHAVLLSIHVHPYGMFIAVPGNISASQGRS